MLPTTSSKGRTSSNGRPNSSAFPHYLRRIVKVLFFYVSFFIQLMNRSDLRCFTASNLPQVFFFFFSLGWKSLGIIDKELFCASFNRDDLLESQEQLRNWPNWLWAMGCCRGKLLMAPANLEKATVYYATWVLYTISWRGSEGEGRVHDLTFISKWFSGLYKVKYIVQSSRIYFSWWIVKNKPN